MIYILHFLQVRIKGFLIGIIINIVILQLFGYTNEVYKYIEKAELIITKPGGITLFEAIYSKTPIFVLRPFLSQEIGNAKFIEKNEIGTVVWDKSENTTQDILNLLRTPKLLEEKYGED